MGGTGIYDGVVLPYPTKKPLGAAFFIPQSNGLFEQIGRRDWTRTNDPHHVKVVL
jgi:hypothetical protein